MRVFFLLWFCCQSAVAADRVVFKAAPGKIAVEIEGKPFTNFYYGWKTANPFLHPLKTVTGLAVTRSFPVEKTDGESSDHIWHHGLWYSHGDINGVDFWRETTGDPAQDSKFPLPVGRMIAKAEPKTAVRGDSGTLTAELDLMTSDNKSLGTVVESFTFSRRGVNHVVDVHVTLRADRGVALKMGDTEEGSLGIRFADEFRQDRGATLLNSDGLVYDRKNLGQTRQVGGLHDNAQGTESWGCHPRSSGEPKIPDLLACAGIWLVCRQPVWRARFSQRQITGWQRHHPQR